MKNNDMAKELAESRKSYAMILKERNYLHATNTNLLMQISVLKNYIGTTLHNARDVLKNMVSASNGLTTIICSQPTILGDFDKSTSINCSDNGNKSPNLSTSMKKQTVSPMVRGHTIMRPTIRLQKLKNIELAGLSSSHQLNNSPEDMAIPSTSQSAENMEEEDNNVEDQENENEMDQENTDSSSNNDGYLIPEQFETIAEEDEGNMDNVSNNVMTNVSNYIDTVPSNAGPLISTVFKNVNLRVYITPSQEIEALTGRLSNKSQPLEENSSESLNSNSNSPIVSTRRKVKRLISPSNSIIPSARKKANLGTSPEKSPNETENEIFMPRITRNRMNSSTHSAKRRVIVGGSPENSSPVTENELFVPRMTRNRSNASMNTTEAELTIPRVTSRKAVLRKTLERSFNTTESEYDMSRNTGNSTMVNNCGSSNHSLDSEDNSTLKSSSPVRGEERPQDTIICGNVNMNNLRLNYSMDETLDMNTLSTVTSTPYGRNTSVLKEKSAVLSPRRSEIARKRGRKKIATNYCSVVLKRMVVRSPKSSPSGATSSSSVQSNRKHTKTKRKDVEKDEQDVHGTPVRQRGRPKRTTKPVDLREPSLISLCVRPRRTAQPSDLKEPSLISLCVRPRRTAQPSDLKEPSLILKLRRM